MTYNTGNPIGSTDARDRSDNSENLDLAVNSLSQTFVDRLGVTRDTLEGIYQKSAYYRAGTFEAGYTLTNNRQTLAYGNVEYSWSGAFPKVVVAGATPEATGGIGAGAWVDRTDLTLRSDLISQDGSSKVGFKQDGAGAVATNVQSKLLEFVSVKDFGAVGDGVTDDTAAIQAAVVANPNNVIIAPRGTYKLSGPISLSTGQTIKGAGRNSTVFYCSGSFDAFVLCSDNSGISDCGFISPVARTSGSYAKLSTATRCNFVRNVTMKNAFYGIHVAANAVITVFEDVEIINTAPGSGIGIFIAGGNDTFLNRVVMDAPAGSQPLCGVRIKSSQATWMTDCDLIHQGIGINIDPGDDASDLITWCFFQDVACDLGIGDGLYINPKNSTVKGLFFDNCWFSSNLNGVNITETGTGAVDGVFFDGCIFFNNKNRGAWVNIAHNVEFNNCKASGNSQSSSGMYAGIEFANSVVSFAVRNTRAGAIAGFPNTQSYGLLLGTGCDQYVVTDNNFTGNVTAGALDNSQASSDNREVRGNIRFKTVASGLATMGVGLNQISVTHGLAGTPTLVLANATGTNLGGLSHWTGAFGASTFNINTSGNVQSSSVFSWTASLYN